MSSIPSRSGLRSVVSAGTSSTNSPAADIALDELLAPSGRTVIRRPDEIRDAAGLLGANGALLAALAAAERELGVGLSDGVLDTVEAVRLTAALTETQFRINALLARVGGVR